MSASSDALENAAQRCASRNVRIPTFEELKDPLGTLDRETLDAIKQVPSDALHPLNLFRCGWKNTPDGGFGGVNYVEIPRKLTGLRCRVLALVGSTMPTSAHKVGPALSCLASRLVQGGFDPTVQKSVWPSTGNFCRGGALTARLLGCESVAILPAEMSQERFAWLEEVGAEVIKTPGSESNVREIYEECRRVKAERGESVEIMNQFACYDNGVFHYNVTASALLEVLEKEMKTTDASNGVRPQLLAFVSSTGSAGTIATGDRLKEVHPSCKIVAGETLQCPTLAENGFGAHRVEGIGDKHVPLIHNVRNTDIVVSPDDEHALSLFRLFNEPAGRELVRSIAGPDLDLSNFGLSGLHNLVCAIKAAKLLEANENDIITTVMTDPAKLYLSRLAEMTAARGEYTTTQAHVDLALHMRGLSIDHTYELLLQDKRRIHNLKYFTWVEQNGVAMETLMEQWDDYRSFWPSKWQRAAHYDSLIRKFNSRVNTIQHQAGQ